MWAKKTAKRKYYNLGKHKKIKYTFIDFIPINK